MLGDVGLLPVGLRPAPCEKSPPDVGDPERVDEPDEGVVPRRLRDREMECPAGVVRGRSRARGALVVDRAPESGEILVRPSLGREAREDGLEVEADLEALEDAAEPEIGNEEAAVHLELDEPVADESAERLPHGAAGDAERVRQLCLPDPRTGGEAPVHDHRAQLVVGQPDDGAHAKRTGGRLAHRISRKVDIRCSNLYTLGVPGARGAGKREEERMSQADSTAPGASLGEKNLSTIHAVAQSLAIGPMFSVALILGGISRPDIGAGWNAALAVLIATLGVLAIGYVVALYARRFAGAGAVYEYLTHGAHPWLGVLTAGFFFVGVLFLGGGGIYLGLGILIDGFWTTHISDSGPAWWIWALITLAIVLALNYRGVRDRRRRDADLRARLVRPDGDPRDRDRRQGRRGRRHLLDVQPERDVVARRHRRRRARRGPARDPPLRRVRGRGLARRGVLGSAPVDPPRRALDDRRRRRVLRLHGLRVLDRLRQGRGRGRRLGVLARPGERDGDEVHRLLVRDAPRARDHPRRDGARARDLRAHRTRLLRARPGRAAAERLREDLAPRHAVGREPHGRRRVHRADRARPGDGLRLVVRVRRRGRGVRALLPERPVRDVHPVGDDRVVRGRARVPDPRGRGVPARAAGGGST